MLSSDSLFHFTDSAENLIGILRNEFYPRYSLEKLELNGERLEMAFPMVCFCDIPLSQIKNHIHTYGSYGIGMSRKWADKMGLNPVLYLRPGAALAEIIYSIVNITVGTEHLKETNSLRSLQLKAADLFKYIKPYEGDFMRKGRLIRNVRFYDEREWRYVPAIDDANDNWILWREEYLNSVKRAHANTQVENAKLIFEPNDIRYLIIKEETQIGAMISALREIKSKYSQETIEILTSRIMTCEQIMRDV